MTHPSTTSRIPESDDFPGEVLEDMGEMPNYNNWIVEHFRNQLRGKVAEIGAGLGTISELLRPHVDSLHLIEPTPALASRLQTRFSNDEGCLVEEKTLESWMASSVNGAYDAIVMVNVLEHIEDDATAARGLFEAIQPGGKLMIFVPALPFLYSELDRIYGHYRRYRRRELRACIESAGFRIDRLHYFDITGVLPWWLLNTLMGKTSFHQPSLTIYDKFLVPPTRLFESVLRPPLGKNLILIASRD